MQIIYCTTADSSYLQLVSKLLQSFNLYTVKFTFPGKVCAKPDLVPCMIYIYILEYSTTLKRKQDIHSTVSNNKLKISKACFALLCWIIVIYISGLKDVALLA